MPDLIETLNPVIKGFFDKNWYGNSFAPIINFYTFPGHKHRENLEKLTVLNNTFFDHNHRDL
jgi:hypothetical protein